MSESTAKCDISSKSHARGPNLRQKILESMQAECQAGLAWLNICIIWFLEFHSSSPYLLTFWHMFYYYYYYYSYTDHIFTWYLEVKEDERIKPCTVQFQFQNYPAFLLPALPSLCIVHWVVILRLTDATNFRELIISETLRHHKQNIQAALMVHVRHNCS